MHIRKVHLTGVVVGSAGNRSECAGRQANYLPGKPRGDSCTVTVLHDRVVP